MRIISPANYGTPGGSRILDLGRLNFLRERDGELEPCGAEAFALLDLSRGEYVRPPLYRREVGAGRVHRAAWLGRRLRFNTPMATAPAEGVASIDPAVLCIYWPPSTTWLSLEPVPCSVLLPRPGLLLSVPPVFHHRQVSYLVCSGVSGPDPLNERIPSSVARIL